MLGNDLAFSISRSEKLSKNFSEQLKLLRDGTNSTLGTHLKGLNGWSTSSYNSKIARLLTGQESSRWKLIFGSRGPGKITFTTRNPESYG